MDKREIKEAAGDVQAESRSLASIIMMRGIKADS